MGKHSYLTFCLFACFAIGALADFSWKLDVPRPGQGSCQLGQFECGDGKCILMQKRCTGVAQCRGGTDEYGCRSYEDYDLPKVCNDPGLFRCRDGSCVDAGNRCDTKTNCFDNSDETGCETVCPEGYFQCNAFICVEEEDLCNGKNDCGNNKDEENCPRNSTSKLKW